MILEHNKSSLILSKGVMEKEVIYQRGQGVRRTPCSASFLSIISTVDNTATEAKARRRYLKPTHTTIIGKFGDVFHSVY